MKVESNEPLEFLRHMEIYQSDERNRAGAGENRMGAWKTERARLCGHALAHRLDEFPVGYSLASCSPAELASASPTALIVSNGSLEGKYFFRRTEGVS